MTAIISPNRAIFVNVALRQTFFPFTARDFACSVTAEPLLASRRNSLSRTKLELVLTFLFSSCTGKSIHQNSKQTGFWRTLLSKQSFRNQFQAFTGREKWLFFLLRGHTIKSSPFRKRLNCRIPYHLNNFLRGRLRGTQDLLGKMINN